MDFGNKDRTQYQTRALVPALIGGGEVFTGLFGGIGGLLLEHCAVDHNPLCLGIEAALYVALLLNVGLCRFPLRPSPGYQTGSF